MSDASNNTPNVEIKQEEEKVFDIFKPSLPLRVRQQGENADVLTYRVNEVTGAKDYWDWTVRMDKFNDALQNKRIPEDNYYDIVVDMLAMSITLGGKKVERSVFESWGLELKNEAFDMAREVNGIKGKKVADKVGNSSSNAEPTTTGSALPDESVAQ